MKGKGLPTNVPADCGPSTNVLNLVDGRSAPAKLIRFAYAEICQDLGGESGLSFAQRSLIMRAANLELLVANREARLLSGELKDDDEFLRAYISALGMLTTIYKTLGLKRKAKDVTPPDLQTYLSSRKKS